MDATPANLYGQGILFPLGDREVMIDDTEDGAHSPLENLPTDVGEALEATVEHWLPPQSLALYARWWQLETWLRQLAYVELRALYGMKWEDVVREALARQSQDAQFTHMASTDTENLVAYLDYSQLLRVIGDHWTQFDPVLIHRPAWEGRREELARIRHRIAHMRRPHADDLERLNQMLRDLERGAFIACSSYNNRQTPGADKHKDAVTVGWILGQHSAAGLIEHAARQYDTQVVLQVSKRPWQTWPANLANAAGIFWHVQFYVKNASVDMSELWHDRSLIGVHPAIVHLAADDPSHFSFTLAAADDDKLLADVVEALVHTVLGSVRRDRLKEPDLKRWRTRARRADYRVICATGWNIVDETTIPISMFAAGGGVTTVPKF